MLRLALLVIACNQASPARPREAVNHAQVVPACLTLIACDFVLTSPWLNDCIEDLDRPWTQQSPLSNAQLGCLASAGADCAAAAQCLGNGYTTCPAAASCTGTLLSRCYNHAVTALPIDCSQFGLNCVSTGVCGLAPCMMPIGQLYCDDGKIVVCR